MYMNKAIKTTTVMCRNVFPFVDFMAQQNKTKVVHCIGGGLTDQKQP